MGAAPDLILAADKELRRLELLIEMHRLHITAVHPSRRAPERRVLQRLLAEYTRLRNSRAGLVPRTAAADCRQLLRRQPMRSRLRASNSGYVLVCRGMHQ